MRRAVLAAAPGQPAVAVALAVAVYPDCEAELKRRFETNTRLLMFVGALVDWTPAAPCEALARAASGAVKPEVETSANTYQTFDLTAPVRVRRDVPNGVNPGQGVHVGGEPAARAASRERLGRFLRRL